MEKFYPIVSSPFFHKKSPYARLYMLFGRILYQILYIQNKFRIIQQYFYMITKYRYYGNETQNPIEKRFKMRVCIIQVPFVVIQLQSLFYTCYPVHTSTEVSFGFSVQTWAERRLNRTGGFPSTLQMKLLNPDTSLRK